MPAKRLRRMESMPRILRVAAGLLIAALLIAGAYWGRSVIVPVALAIILTFLLTPVVSRLEKWRFPRLAAVLIAVAAACSLFVGAGWLLVSQMYDFANDLPHYRSNIKQKIADVRELSQGGPIEKVRSTMSDLNRELDHESSPRETARQKAQEQGGAWLSWWLTGGPAERDALTRESTLPPSGKAIPPTEEPLESTRNAGSPRNKEPILVQVTSGKNPLTEALTRMEPAVSPVVTAGFVLILVIFMLLQRENLRNRIVSLNGTRSIARTTEAIHDGTERISRFLLAQFIINLTFGIAVGIGLVIIGVPYALLWGVAAALLRYIPYIGPWIAASLPLAVALVAFEGWTQVALVVSLFAVLELLSNNVMEPVMYRQSVGISEVGILISAAFWAWLWGPVGLLLSTPLTVCLVVLGKHARCLSFFHHLLGDEDLVKPDVLFYQRLLARDHDEALRLLAREAEKTSPEEAFQLVVIPALSLARLDAESGLLLPEQEQELLSTTRDIVEEFPMRETVTDQPTDNAGEAHRLIFGCPGSDEFDAMALFVLSRQVETPACEFRVLSEELLMSEIIDELKESEHAPVVCIGALPQGGLLRVKLLCKRLRKAIPSARIVVTRFLETGSGAEVVDELKEAGANFVEPTSQDAIRRVRSLAILSTRTSPADRAERSVEAAQA